MKILYVLAGLTTFVGAAAGADAPVVNGQKSGACRQIMQVCESAGYQKGKHAEGKGLYKDCLQPIMNGQSVSGVSVDQTLVAACREKHQRQTHKAPEKL